MSYETETHQYVIGSDIYAAEFEIIKKGEIFKKVVGSERFVKTADDEEKVLVIPVFIFHQQEVDKNRALRN